MDGEKGWRPGRDRYTIDLIRGSFCVFVFVLFEVCFCVLVHVLIVGA